MVYLSGSSTKLVFSANLFLHLLNALGWRSIRGVFVCRDKKDIIVYLIDNALHGNLQGAEKMKNITLHISKADMGIVTAKKDDLVKGLNKDIEVDIIEDTSLEHNQCVIDFDTKVIDCSLDTQLKSLRDSLKMLAM